MSPPRNRSTFLLSVRFPRNLKPESKTQTRNQNSIPRSKLERGQKSKEPKTQKRSKLKRTQKSKEANTRKKPKIKMAKNQKTPILKRDQSSKEAKAQKRQKPKRNQNSEENPKAYTSKPRHQTLNPKPQARNTTLEALKPDSSKTSRRSGVRWRWPNNRDGTPFRLNLVERLGTPIGS